MDNITMLCMFGLFMMFILLVLPRLMNMGQNQYGYDPRNDDDYRGGERPRYDDPDVEGRGGFGRDRDTTTRDTTGSRSSNFPWVGNRRSGGGSSAGRPSVDNRNVRGRGSFGRNKD